MLFLFLFVSAPLQAEDAYWTGFGRSEDFVYDPRIGTVISEAFSLDENGTTISGIVKSPNMPMACESLRRRTKNFINGWNDYFINELHDPPQDLYYKDYYALLGFINVDSNNVLLSANCDMWMYVSIGHGSSGWGYYTDRQVWRIGDTCTPPKTLSAKTGGCELPSDDNKNPPEDPCHSTPNPINYITGNKYLDEVDAPAAGNSPLRFARQYNSKGAYQYDRTFGTAGEASNPMGERWSHNYYQGLTVSTDSVKYTLSTGQTFTFRPVVGNWRADADVDYHLEEITLNAIRTGWKITTPDDIVESYSAIGDLLTITDTQGLSQTLSYSCTEISANCPTPTPAAVAPFAGLLLNVTDALGKSLSFTYNSDGKMASMTNPAGQTTLYAYDALGVLATVTYPDNTLGTATDNPKKTYLYSELDNTANTPQFYVLTGIIDENGNRTATYQYGTDGRAIAEYSNGNIDKYTIAYAPDVTSTTVTDPLGTSRTTHLTTVLGIVKSTGSDQPAGSGCSASASNIGYDANGNVAYRTDFNGNRTNFSYDLTRNLETSRTEGLTSTGATTPATRTVTTEWHPTFRLPTKITEPGLETSFSYDSKGNVTLKTLKDLVTNKTRAWHTTYTYSGSGILLSKSEDWPRTDVSDITTYTYYPEDAVCAGGHNGCRGQLKQITPPLGHSTQITRYSAYGLPEVVIDPNGLTSTMTYDVRQRLVSLDVGGEVTNYTYDPAGQLIRVTQPNGAYLAYRYDNAHRLIEIKDQLGNARNYALDNMGNRIKEELHDPSGQLARSQTRVYDALSRLQNLVLPQ